MELLLIIVLALIVFGPAKLPEIMGQVGKAVNDFRRATSDLSEEFNKTIQAELQETKSVVDEAKAAMTDAQGAVTDVHRRSIRLSPVCPPPPAWRTPRWRTNGTPVDERHQRRRQRHRAGQWPTPPLADTTPVELGDGAPARAEAAVASEPEASPTASKRRNRELPTRRSRRVAPAAPLSKPKIARRDELLPPY